MKTRVFAHKVQARFGEWEFRDKTDMHITREWGQKGKKKGAPAIAQACCKSVKAPLSYETHLVGYGEH